MVTALRHYRALAVASALVLLATWEIVALVVAHESTPTPEDWKAAAAAVRASSNRDALIVFAPRWIDPLGRLWLGDRMSLDQAARMDAARYREVWEVSSRGATAPELAGETPVSEHTFGQIRVRQFVRRPPTIAWDLSGQSRIHEVGFEPRKGVLLELGHAYQQQRLFFRRATLGSVLHVYAGLANYRTRSENRATALLQVLIDGREITRGYVGNDSGWLPLPVASMPPGEHDIEFVARVHEPRGPIVLALCVAAESRTP